MNAPWMSAQMCSVAVVPDAVTAGEYLMVVATPGPHGHSVLIGGTSADLWVLVSELAAALLRRGFKAPLLDTTP